MTTLSTGINISFLFKILTLWDKLASDNVQQFMIVIDLLINFQRRRLINHSHNVQASRVRGRCQQNQSQPRRSWSKNRTKDELQRVLPWRSIEWKGRATRWDSLSRAINFGSDGLFRPDRANLFRLNEAGTGRLGREPSPRSAWPRVEPAAVAKSCRLV